MKYYSSSEFVSSGHPDRLADNIAAALIDAIQTVDGVRSHAAVEVFITRDTVIFGGEITTTLKITDALLRNCVNVGYERSGYIPDMRKYWTIDQVALADDMKIANKLSPQSPDIALGTTDKGENSGYNDQGVFYSSADCSTPARIGLPMQIAADISKMLSEESRHTIASGKGVVLGPDNKVVVTVAVGEDGFTPDGKDAITGITVAVAHTQKSGHSAVYKKVKKLVTELINDKRDEYGTGLNENCAWIVNGTGKFVVHGASSDTSMTGRKISVNHPSAGPVWCNKMIGGGSLVKPWHASDFILNVTCRLIANVVIEAHFAHYAVVGCGCAIGSSKPQSFFVKSDSGRDSDIAEFFNRFMNFSPISLANMFGFWNESYSFLDVVDNNFFGNAECQPWESPELIKNWADRLETYLLNEEE